MINDENDVYSISADEVTIKVTDAQTGRSFERSLPMDYFENENGIMLGGEDIDGKSVIMCFLSSEGLKKRKDASGQGPDEGRHPH
jgi:hypothetical protein